jgi:ligand-binding SRPBCC domain-containing protein
MGFHILSKERPARMYAGQLIEYRVSPVLGIPMYWMTEITHVVDGMYFIDEQRFGPYALWHHQHHFRAVEGGVEMTDIVHYKIPLGLLGWIADRLFVRQKLEQIFDYRYRKVAELFS